MTGDKMGEVLDTFLLLLGDEAPDKAVVLGVTDDGQELWAGRHEEQVGSAQCVTVFMQVPEAPRGRVYVVLCRWTDEEDALIYAAPQEGAVLPDWKLVELVAGGVRLSVQWPGEERPHAYEFHWLPAMLPPSQPS